MLLSVNWEMVEVINKKGLIVYNFGSYPQVIHRNE